MYPLRGSPRAAETPGPGGPWSSWVRYRADSDPLPPGTAPGQELTQACLTWSESARLSGGRSAKGCQRGRPIESIRVRDSRNVRCASGLCGVGLLPPKLDLRNFNCTTAMLQKFLHGGRAYWSGYRQFQCYAVMKTEDQVIDWLIDWFDWSINWLAWGNMATGQHSSKRSPNSKQRYCRISAKTCRPAPWCLFLRDTLPRGMTHHSWDYSVSHELFCHSSRQSDSNVGQSIDFRPWQRLGGRPKSHHDPDTRL